MLLAHLGYCAYLSIYAVLVWACFVSLGYGPRSRIAGLRVTLCYKVSISLHISTSMESSVLLSNKVIYTLATYLHTYKKKIHTV
jgi:hypothetical protein